MTINRAAASKINWANGGAFLVAALAVFGIAVPQDLQDAVVKLVALGAPLVTIILRSFFTWKPGAIALNPALLSKINFTNALGFIVAVLATFGIAVPDQLQHQVLDFIAVGLPLVTMVLRTYFTGKPASGGGAGGVLSSLALAVLLFGTLGLGGCALAGGGSNTALTQFNDTLNKIASDPRCGHTDRLQGNLGGLTGNNLSVFLERTCPAAPPDTKPAT